MESSPLTSAHAHARAAYSKGLSTTAAIEEHSLAAGEFAHAASTTGDAEAIRTLVLLEQHHRKLAELLKFRSSHPPPPKPVDVSTPPKDDADHSDLLVDASQKAAEDAAPPRRPSSPPRTQAPPTLSLPHRSTPRDLTSSIASNLASARGIPSSQRRRGAPVSPTLSDQHAGGKMSSTPTKTSSETRSQGQRSPTREKSGQPTAHHDQTRSAHGPKSNVSNGSSEESPKQETVGAEANPNDEPFQRFYSTFENLLSRLSAPLAFAGLPLGNEDTAPVPKPAKTGEERDVTSTESDLTRMFSKAALRAVRDGNNPAGAGGDSFYVVPSTGGTISYAGILSRAEQERRAAAALDATITTEDEFVDAREVPQPPSPTWPRTAGRRNPAPGTKSMEELQLENRALKQLSDTLSRRLHMWEVNAQSSSLALQQSLRAMHASPPASDAGGGGGAGTARAADADLVKELEEQLRATSRENAKLKEVVARYRSKWEKLKEGARMRREGGGASKSDEGRDEPLPGMS